MGKGFSIKKLFVLYLKKKYIDGVIIADSDGQHSINDINKILKLYSKNSNKFIIGQRKFKFFKTFKKFCRKFNFKLHIFYKI